MTTNARPCSIADALGVIGEKYSLLVLREIFFGVRRFDAIALNIGAPRDVLAARARAGAGAADAHGLGRPTPRRPSAGRLRAQLRRRPTTRCRLPRLRPRGKLPLVDPTLHRSQMDHQRAHAEGQPAGSAPHQPTLNTIGDKRRVVARPAEDA